MDYLVPRVRAEFGDRPMTISLESRPEIVFPGIHPEVGDIEIHDDGDELMVVLGNFTHMHFCEYEEGITDAEREEIIAEDIVRYLEEIFADRVEFWGQHCGSGGSHPRRDKPRGFVARTFFGTRETYVWSGPVKTDR